MAIKTYKKGNAVQLSENFKSTEFDCHGSGCCSSTEVDEELVKYLQKIRDYFGKPITVTSGYRCPTHNKNIGGATGSRHSKGQAADIVVSGVAPAEVAKYAESIGILGIGLYETNSDGHFVHVDTRTTKSFWYGQSEKYRSTFGGTPIKEEPKVEEPKKENNTKMKYSKDNPPLCCMQTQSSNYKGASIIDIKGILWHSTGANNPNLRRYVQPSDTATDRAEWLTRLGVNTAKNDWNHKAIEAGLNAWIGKLADGTVATVQTMPWNYKPWGCGSGSKGSCNNGWIQFEICEDGLTDGDYFAKVYEEACQLTAYLCDMFDIDPIGYVTYNGVKVPTILCHSESNKLGLGSNHSDVMHWFPKHGKDMDDVREDVAALLKNGSSPVAPKELYRVRKDWDNEKSQVGAYSSLENAKKACDKAGEGYEVYDSKGVCIYPEPPKVEIVKNFKIRQEVQLKSDAIFVSGNKVPGWMFNCKFYVQGYTDEGYVKVGNKPISNPVGTFKQEYITEYTGKFEKIKPTLPKFEPYLIQVTASVLNVRSGPGTGYKVVTQIKRHSIATIIDVKDGWGKLKNGTGWIKLEYTKKVD